MTFKLNLPITQYSKLIILFYFPLHSKSTYEWVNNFGKDKLLLLTVKVHVHTVTLCAILKS